MTCATSSLISNKILDQTQPILLAQLSLPGEATDVAFAPNLQMAVVAANEGGLHLVDVLDPVNPRLIRTLPVHDLRSAIVSARLVEVRQEAAYVFADFTLLKIDLVSGNTIQTLRLDPVNVLGVALEGSLLYLLGNNRVLQVVDISGEQMKLRGALSLPCCDGLGQIFVGNSIAYLGSCAGLRSSSGVSDGGGTS